MQNKALTCRDMNLIVQKSITGEFDRSDAAQQIFDLVQNISDARRALKALSDIQGDTAANLIVTLAQEKDLYQPDPLLISDSINALAKFKSDKAMKNITRLCFRHQEHYNHALDIFRRQQSPIATSQMYYLYSRIEGQTYAFQKLQKIHSDPQTTETFKNAIKTSLTYHAEKYLELEHIFKKIKDVEFEDKLYMRNIFRNCVNSGILPPPIIDLFESACGIGKNDRETNVNFGKYGFLSAASRHYNALHNAVFYPDALDKFTPP